MIRTVSVAELHFQLERNKKAPRGLVPTMGALHPGHLSLVNKSMSECPVTVVSIFVNPTQFNDRTDLINYPRTPGRDLELLGTLLRKDDIVFMPEVKDIYPEEDNRVFDLAGLDKVMEGLHRPGHFNGVAQVVTRLLDITDPDIAYFGQKDFQQLTIIRHLVRQAGMKTRIVGCPIIREEDGLAMSSRNMLLDQSIREKAAIIYKTLREASAMTDKNPIQQIREFAMRSVNTTEGFSMDYFEIVDDIELKPVKSRSEIKRGSRYYGCIAVRAGNIRLIDNHEFSFPESKG